MTALPGFKEFNRHIDSTLVAETASGKVALKLDRADVVDRPDRPADLPKPLSLIFTSENQLILSQDVYTLNHPDLGRLQLCLVPVVSGDPNKPFYQAIIN